MKFSSLPKRVFALAAMGLMATLPTISPASAIEWDHGPWHSTDSSPYGATVYVEEHDDIIKLCDTESDKLHAKVYIWTGPTDNLSQVSWFTDWYNDGHCSYEKASTGYNLAENRTYYIQVCREYNDGDQADVNCTSYTKYHFYNDH